MEQCRADGLAAQSDVGHDDLGHLDGMYDVRLSRAPADVLVGLVGEFKRLLHGLDLLFVAKPRARHIHQGCVLLVNQAIVVLSEF